MVEQDVKAILVEVLGLGCSPGELDRGTGLLGDLPEFDSMAVVSVLTAVEEQFGVLIEDDEVDASIFENVGTLVDFVETKAA